MNHDPRPGRHRVKRLPLTGRSPDLMNARLPLRPRSHALEDESKVFTQSVLPSEWVVEETKRDYGIDLRVEIFENGTATGDEFLIQLKATDHLRTKGDFAVFYGLKTSTLRYYLLKRLPIVFLLYDARRKVGYWLWIKDYVRHQLDVFDPVWSQKRTVSLVVPLSNSFDASAVESIRATLRKARAPSNLPPRETFVASGSRGRELQDLRARLARRTGTWVISIEGIGGIGKTALALETAHQCLDTALFDGVIWLAARAKPRPIGGVSEEPLVSGGLRAALDVVARTLGHSELARLSLNEKLDAIRQLLRSGRYLLIVDNLETRKDWTTYQPIRALLQPSKLILTSRPQIGRADYTVALREMDPDEARSLLKLAATRYRAASLLHASPSEIEAVLHATGCVPLAIEWLVGHIAIAATPLATALSYLRRIRGQPLAFIFKHTVAALSPGARLVLEVASIFPAAFTGLAHRSASGLPTALHTAAMGQLLRSSVIQYDAALNRYSLLPLARTYASRLLTQHPQRQVRAFRGATHFFLDVTARFGKDPSHFDYLESELPNLLRVYNWNWSLRRYRTVVRFCEAFAYPGFLFLRGFWSELDDCLRLATRAAVMLNDHFACGRFLAESAWLAFCRGNITLADRHTAAALRFFRSLRDSHRRNKGIAIVYDYKGQIAGAKKDYHRARHLLEQSLTLWEKEGELEDQAITLHNLGTIADFQGDTAAAQQFFARSLAIKKRLRVMPSRLAITHLALATVTRKQQRLKHAGRQLQLAENIVRDVNDKRLLAYVLQEKTRLVALADRDAALLLATQARSLWESLDSARDMEETDKMISSIRRGQPIPD